MPGNFSPLTKVTIPKYRVKVFLSNYLQTTHLCASQISGCLGLEESLGSLSLLKYHTKTFWIFFSALMGHGLHWRKLEQLLVTANDAANLPFISYGGYCQYYGLTTSSSNTCCQPVLGHSQRARTSVTTLHLIHEAAWTFLLLWFSGRQVTKRNLAKKYHWTWNSANCILAVSIIQYLRAVQYKQLRASSAFSSIFLRGFQMGRQALSTDLTEAGPQQRRKAPEIQAVTQADLLDEGTDSIGKNILTQYSPHANLVAEQEGLIP